MDDLLVDYYRNGAVRARIAEYCGGDTSGPGSFTALALAAYGGRRRLAQHDGSPVPMPLEAWPDLLEDGADVCRSLGDRTGTLVLLDIDYVNHADAEEPYRDPARTFERLEPVLACATGALESYGIRHLVLMTGRGYHLVFKVPAHSPLERALADAGGPEAWHPPDGARGGGHIHDGAGRMMEYLAQRIARETAADIPIALLDLPPADPGPFICLDITAYGDRLEARNTRCAFSGNQKARMRAHATGTDVVAVIPRGHESLGDLLAVRADLEAAADFAAHSTVALPSVETADDWVADYRASALRSFHRFYDRPLPDVRPPDVPAWPPCVRLPLDHPNAALLTPGWLRTVALTLWSHGWHPRRITALVRSRYSRDDHWGDYWDRYDRGTRAGFYVRVCCGAVATGLERWAAFSCRSQRERGFCPLAGSACGFELGRVRPLSPEEAS